MARPLPGYSAKGVTLTAPGSVPGSAVDEPLAVTTTDDVGVERAEPHDGLTGAELDAGHAATAAALGAHAGGAEVQQLRVGADEAQLLVAGAQLDRADHLVAVLEADHVPLVPAEDLGVHPLHHALPGAEREAGPVGAQRAQREHPLAVLERAHQVEGQPALEVRVVGRARAAPAGRAR